MYLPPQSRAQINRRLAVALGVSLLLHSPLLLPPGSFHFGSLSDSAEPVLEITLVAPSQGQPDAPAQPENSQLEEVLVAASQKQPQPAQLDTRAPVESPTRDAEEVAQTDEPATEDATSTEPGETSTPSDKPSPTAETAMASTDAPRDDEPAAEDSEPSVGPADTETVAALSPTQEVVLTKRLAREARELLASGGLEGTLAFEDRNRKYTAVLTRQPANGATGVERVAVAVTSEQGGERAVTRLQMKRLAFSHFTEFIDRWDPWVQLHDDVIVGRLHSNTEILLTYDRKVAPRLLGKVTTAKGITVANEEGWRPRREIFVGGLETGTPRIRLPKVALPAAAESEAGVDVHVLGRDSLIIFLPDGHYDCVDLASRAEERRRLEPGKPTYIVAATDTTLEVRGVVNGSVTVYSPQRIVVQGSLLYARDPRSDRESDDYLGLMSDGNVEIEGAKEIGRGDLLVQAAIYARQRFVTRNAYARRAGTLSIYGSLTSGSISETEPRFAMHMAFDRRFERVRPPGFPETDRYELESWDGRWRSSEATTQ